jgi:hypothetical protein
MAEDTVIRSRGGAVGAGSTTANQAATNAQIAAAAAARAKSDADAQTLLAQQQASARAAAVAAKSPPPEATPQGDTVLQGTGSGKSATGQNTSGAGQTTVTTTAVVETQEVLDAGHHLSSAMPDKPKVKIVPLKLPPYKPAVGSKAAIVAASAIAAAYYLITSGAFK